MFVRDMCTKSAMPTYYDKKPVINEKRHEKTNVLVSDLVRHKPGCIATEDG